MRNPTLFYSLPLQGIGTCEVESLRSYVYRLAFAHSMKARSLLQLAVNRLGWNGGMFDLHSLLKTWVVHGAGALGARLTDLLERATSVDLTHSTLGRLAPLLAEQHLTLPGHGRYCPVCVLGSESHGRLLWEVACVTACPVHGVRLRDASVCGAPVEEHLNRARRPRLSHVCNACGRQGFTCLAKEPEPASEDEVRAAEQVGRLVAVSTSQVNAWSAQTVQQGIRAVVDHAFGGQVVRAAREAGLARGVVCSWASGSMRPSLAGLVRLCLAGNADLVDVFEGRFTPLTADEEQVQPAPIGVPRPTRMRAYARRVEVEDLAEVLLAAAEEPSPPSLHAFAARHGTHVRILTRKWPEAARALSQASAAYREKVWHEQEAEAQRRYEEAACELRDAGRLVTEKNLQQTAGLVAFSQNVPRRRALRTVLSKERGIAPPPT